MLHSSQEGYRPQCNTSRQIQMIIATLEDTRLANKDIHLTYIDIRNAFGFIDHARLLALIENLSFPLNVVKIVRDIYKNSTTSFTRNHFGTTSQSKLAVGPYKGTTLAHIYLSYFWNHFWDGLKKTTWDTTSTHLPPYVPPQHTQTIWQSLPTTYNISNHKYSKYKNLHNDHIGT